VGVLWHGAASPVINLRQTAKLLGSLKLAVALLSIVTAVLIAATFYESHTTTAAVTAHVYRTWWFNALLGAIGVNLATAAVLRWPWKRHQVGFIVTHAGLILILGGCSASFHFGTEGLMGLRVGEPPSNTVQLEERALIVMSPEVTRQTLRVDRRGNVHPHKVSLPGGLQLTLDEFHANASSETVAREGATEWSPAVQIRLHSTMAAHDARQWLFAGSRSAANISLVVAADAAHLSRLTNAPPAGAVKEVRLVVALQDRRLDVPMRGNVEKDLTVPGTDLTVRVLNYWPDFRMNEKHEIVNASDEPNNPVAMLSLTRGESAERWFVFGNPQMRPLPREQRGTPIGAELQLLAPVQQAQMTLVALDGSSGLFFAAQNKDGFKSGPVTPGQTLELGWMDARMTVERFLTNAVPGKEVVRLPDGAEQPQPALRVTVSDGKTSSSEWLLFGQPVVLRSAGKPMHLMFGWDSMPLPFTVALEDFVVERDEGNHNVAGWMSKVRFADAVTGAEKRADVWMNHPAVFKGYKFSQASWNPQDLQYTVLQVKKDPLWVIVLTWGGSGLTIIGIGLMFYARRWV